jgi:betaine-aldehyde dehydrogenase
MDQNSPIQSLPSGPRGFGFYVDGKWVEPGERKTMLRHSPAHDVPVTEITLCDTQDLDTAVAAARRAFDDRRWSGLPGGDRAAVLLKAAAIIRANVDELAYYETLETGKPIAQSRDEASGSAGIYEYGAGAARALHGDTFNNLGDKMLGLVMREPIGVVGVITPWNFPLFILSERVPFILAAGCTIVAKPSEYTSATTLMIAEMLSEAGLPDGVFNVVTGEGPVIGQAMTEHAGIDMVSFTGSTRVGRSAIKAASGNFKKLGLELGGKNPQIVFADADLEDAADGVAFGLAFNAGQCCVSGSRLIVERSVAEEFEKLLIDKLSRIRIGDPLDPQTQIGAITTVAQNKAILGYIEAGRKEGANLATGGGALDLGTGRYIEPTLFTNVDRNMTIAKEEIFGPVLTMMTFDTMEEAITIANDVRYGLAASIWTKHVDKAVETARRVQAGRVWVNCTITGGPELPIGGFKESGWGRETGIYGVEEYTQIKSIHLELGKRSHWISG